MKEVIPMPIKPFKDLSLVDDFMFSEVMRQPENIKPFLETLLEKKIQRVVAIDKQKDLKDTYDAHGIRLDVYLEDEHNTKYDVEVQIRLHRKLEKRIRYYASGIDRRSLEMNADYEELSDNFVIFICVEDYFKAGLAVYERESHIKGAPEIPYKDGSHAYILNADFTKENGNPAVMDFLRYVRASYRGERYDISKSSYLQQIEEAVNKVKEDSGREMEYMTLAMKMMDERKEAFEQGQRASQIKTIKRMLARGLSLEEISDMIGLELDEAERLAKQV
ncbi:MAG: Rpn family recombination-promoting nuclease/putative transposase [Oscillospiraceae bacterium]|nr:Rpn family recombination-promoting nuclease/putative transposase [Oscillospiraceae bacterium]